MRIGTGGYETASDHNDKYLIREATAPALALGASRGRCYCQPVRKWPAAHFDRARY